MATYVETKIAQALMSHLAALTLDPVMAVAWPDSGFPGKDAKGEPLPKPDRYLRATHAPNTADQITLGDLGKNRFFGLMQVDVMWPEDRGYTAPTEIAGAIAAHFKRGTDITFDGVTVRIIKPPRVAPQLQSPPYVQVPVMIRYQCDADNPS